MKVLKDDIVREAHIYADNINVQLKKQTMDIQNTLTLTLTDMQQIIKMAELYEFSGTNFIDEAVATNQLALFSQRDDNLKALGQNEVAPRIPFHIEPLENDERHPVIRKI